MDDVPSSPLDALHKLQIEFTASAEAMSKAGFHDNAYWGAASRVREMIEQFADGEQVVLRYLVLANGLLIRRDELNSEDAAIEAAENTIFLTESPRLRTVEVVRSVRRWERDDETGEMLEVGEKVENRGLCYVSG